MPQKKENNKAAQTREHMLKCALAIIREEGIERLSMDRLAEHSQMSKGAVMYHFRTKQELLSALIERYAAHMQLMLERSEERLEGTPQQTLVPAYVDWFRAFERANSDWSTVGLSLLSQQVRTPEVLSPMREWYDRLFARLHDVPPEKRGAALVNVLALEGLFYLHKFGLDRLSHEQIQEVFTQINKDFPPLPAKKKARGEKTAGLEEETLSEVL